MVTVAELIAKLKSVSQEAEIEVWDGDFQPPVPILKIHVENDYVWLETGLAK